MKIIAISLLIFLSLCRLARGETPPPGCCQGGYHPAKNCKTCQYCWYCGTKKSKYWPARPQNTGKCMVCAPELFPAKNSK